MRWLAVGFCLLGTLFAANTVEHQVGDVQYFVDRLERYAFRHSHKLVENANFWVDSLDADSGSTAFLFVKLHQAKQLANESRYDSALKVLEGLLPGIEEERPYPSLLFIRFYRQLGNLYSLMRFEGIGADYYLKAKSKAEEAGNIEQMVHVQLDFAEIHRKLGLMPEAWENLDSAGRMIAKYPVSPETMQRYHGRRGACIDIQEWPPPPKFVDSVRKEMRMAMHFAKLSNDSFEIAANMNGLAAMMAEADKDSARHYHRQAAEIWKVMGATEEVINAYWHLSMNFEIEQQCDSIQRYNQKLRQMNSEYPGNTMISAIADRWVEYFYLCEPNADSVRYYHKQYLSARNRDQVSKQNLDTQFIQAKFKKEEQDKKIAAQQAEIAEVAASRQRTLLGGSAVVVFALVLLWLWLRLRKSNAATLRSAAALAQSNDALAVRVKEKEVLIGEIHHRVKNNLQITANLLQAQADRNGDPIIRLELESTKTRLAGMATIQDVIYGQEDVQHVDMKVFLQMLADESIAYMADGDCAAEIHCEDVQFAHTLAIDIGIILLELITNSIKYARIDDQDLEIDITLNSTAPSQYEFRYRDNGPGMPNSSTAPKGTGMGNYVIDAMIRQCDGTRSENNGNQDILAFSFKV